MKKRTLENGAVEIIYDAQETMLSNFGDQVKFAHQQIRDLKPYTAEIEYCIELLNVAVYRAINGRGKTSGKEIKERAKKRAESLYSGKVFED